MPRCGTHLRACVRRRAALLAASRRSVGGRARAARGGTPKRDYAAAAWTILPPGENGSLTFDRNTTDQAKLYDGLTPLSGAVTARDLRRFFKPAPLGLGRDRRASASGRARA